METRQIRCEKILAREFNKVMYMNKLVNEFWRKFYKYRDKTDRIVAYELAQKRNDIEYRYLIFVEQAKTIFPGFDYAKYIR